MAGLGFITTGLVRWVCNQCVTPPPPLPYTSLLQDSWVSVCINRRDQAAALLNEVRQAWCGPVEEGQVVRLSLSVECVAAHVPATAQEVVEAEVQPAVHHRKVEQGAGLGRNGAVQVYA